MDVKVKQLCSSLLGDRALERKRACDALSETIKAEGVALEAETWKQLFDAAHTFLLKEVDRAESGKANRNLETMCTPLLTAVVVASNKAKHLNTDKVFDAFDEVLHSPSRSGLVGNAYISMLNKHILNVRHYLLQTTPARWTELLDLSITLCERRTTDAAGTLRLLATTIREGVTRCHFVKPIADNLRKITRILKNEAYLKDNLQETYLDIIIVILENICTESRLSICLFTETLLPNILKIYEKITSTYKMKKKYLFRVFNLTITIHHPKGRLGGEGSLAGDWDSWNKLVVSIYQIVIAESMQINELLKKRITTSDFMHDVDLHQEYIKLATKTCHLIFAQNVITPNTENIPKRIKMEYHNFLTLSQVLESLNANIYPWIDIIESYIRKYGDTFCDNDKLSMLSTFISLVERNDLDSFHHHIYNAICSLCETIDKKSSNEKLLQLFTKIWNTVIIKGSVQNSSFSSCHKIIHFFLINQVPSRKLDSLLKFFIDKTMPFCKDSILTLKFILLYHNNELGDVTKRLQLLEWILHSFPNFSSDLNPLIASTLFKMCIKGCVLEDMNCEMLVANNIYSNIFEDYENFMLFNDFELGLLIEDKFLPEKSELATVNHSLSMWNKLYDLLLCTFSAMICDVNLKYKESNYIQKDIFKIVDITFQLITLFINHNIISSIDDLKEIKLQLVSALDIINKSTENTSENTAHCLSLLSAFKLIYATEFYNEYVVLFIRNRTSKTMIEFICNQLDSEESEYEINNLDSIDNNLESSCKAMATDLILLYNYRKSLFTDETLQLILNKEDYDMKKKSEFDIAVKVISHILNNVKGDIPKESILPLLQKMCNHFYRDNDASFVILNLFYDTLKFTDAFESINKTNCIKLLEGYMRMCSSHCYSPKTMIQIMKCASWMLINAKDKTWINSDTCERLFKIILEALCSNLHSIRLTACYILIIYLKKISPESYVNVLQALHTLCTVDESDWMKDDGANRFATILHCLAGIAVSSQVWDKLSVVAIFEIAHEKNINIKLIEKVVALIAKSFNLSVESFVAQNLSFVINSLYSSTKSISAIPWSLVNCKTIVEFYRSNATITLPLEWFYLVGDDRKCLKEATSGTKVQPKDLINECLPRLLVLCLSNAVNEEPNFGSKNLSEYLIQQFGEHESFTEEVVLRRSVTENVEKILLGFLNLISDEDAISSDFEWQDYMPYATKPVITKKDFHKVVHYLDKIFEIKLLDHLCCNTSKVIQNVFLNLWSSIESNNTLERKLVSLHQYWIFCELLPLNNMLNNYICSFIVNSLINLINIHKCSQKYDTLRVIASKLLGNFIINLSSYDLSTVIQLLPKIVSTLINCSLEDDKKYGHSIQTLNYIYTKEEFRENLKILDPLPKVSIFSNIDFEINETSSLEDYIDNFLKGGKLARIEGLKILHEKLINKKSELKLLFDNLGDIRGFSEDCKKSKLHRLICVLQEIAHNRLNEKESHKACCCLGEIGPSNLHTLMLSHLDSTHELIESPSKCFVYAVLINIKDSIFDESSIKIEAASIALLTMFSFVLGRETLDLMENSSKYSGIKKLMLPFTKKTTKKPIVRILDPLFDTFLDRPDIWCDFEYKKHSDWIVDIAVSSLKTFSIENSFFNDLIKIFQIDPYISENCFPSLVGLMLSIGTKVHISKINSHIQKFFNDYWDNTFISHEQSVSSSPINKSLNNTESKKNPKIYDKESINCMLNLVQFIRLQLKHYGWYESNKNMFLLDYLPIAWAAYTNGSYFMAVLFCELWCINKSNNIPTSNSETIENMPNGENMLLIMRMSYQAIGDADALSGCGFAHLSKPSGKINHYMSTRSYFDSILLHDISLSSPRNQIASSSQDIAIKKFAKSLNMSGLYYMTEKFIQNTNSSEYIDDIKFDCLWRLGDWNIELDSSALKLKRSKNEMENYLDSNDLWSAYHYLSLKNALERKIEKSDERLTEILNESRDYAIALSHWNCIESSQGFYVLAMKLQILQEIQQYIDMISKEKGTPFSGFLEQWNLTKLLPFNDFKYIEPILSQRLVIFDHMSQHTLKPDAGISLSKICLEYAELALLHGWTNTSNRWVNFAVKICDGYKHSNNLSQLNGLIQLTEGKVAWHEGHQEVALHLVKSVMLKKDNIDNNLYAKALMQYGSWMIETRRENPQVILNKYFRESLERLKDEADLPSKLAAHFAIARFADEEYKQIDGHIKSPVYLNKLKFLERCRETYTSLCLKKDVTKEENKARVFSKQQIKIDENEISNIMKEKTQYLRLAMKCYLQSMLDGEDHNLSVFRYVSLWLDNPDVELGPNSDKTLEEYLNLISSRKFILVVPQLAPRMNLKDDSIFQNTLHNLIEKCAFEHPHHILPILLALKHSSKDDLFKTEPQKKRKYEKQDNDEYVSSAEKIIKSLMGKTKILPIIQEMEKLSLAMIRFAYYEPNEKVDKKNLCPIPRQEPISSLKMLTNISIPTMTLPINNNCVYNNIPYIISFSQTFLFVGGINAPKKISCRCSDGIERYMLVKGQDDIRQDAVMQQVFGIVNQLLTNDRGTKQRHLLIRTYKIVVLSRFSGIIEWCDGTEPLGILLTGANGASGYHSKYRPDDLSPMKARAKLRSRSSGTNEEKLQTFNEILKSLKPAFHFFFIENFLTPSIWYERRLAYTHSVATSSMIGYILGLGDRHVQNILVDKSTAEVVHIDFGIAFEQGRLQPTPETVPFRLTQDLVAGFGCTGTEGVFQRSCEKTMEVLKSNKETLVTILEVLLWDPLYIWTLSQQQAFEKQNVEIPDLQITSLNNHCGSSNEKTVSEAERALSKVRSKLEGSDSGRTLATSGQVMRLIQQATDPNNLSRLFSGWQAYL